MPSRYMVLGGPIPVSLRETLNGVIELVAEREVLDAEVDGVMIHARPESQSIFRRFRKAGASLPVFALVDGKVALAGRLRWIRQGANDLLDLAGAAETLRRTIRALQLQEAERQDAERGMFLDRYLRCLHRYVAARQALVERLGEEPLSLYLDCVNLRDQALKASEGAPADAFGQRRAGQREVLTWPIQAAAPATSSGILLNIGADGCAASLPVEPSENVRLTLNTGAISATLDLEVRWRRRASVSRWDFGGLIVAVQLMESEPTGA